MYLQLPLNDVILPCSLLWVCFRETSGNRSKVQQCRGQSHCTFLHFVFSNLKYDLILYLQRLSIGALMRCTRPSTKAATLRPALRSLSLADDDAAPSHLKTYFCLWAACRVSWETAENVAEQNTGSPRGGTERPGRANECAPASQ